MLARALPCPKLLDRRRWRLDLVAHIAARRGVAAQLGHIDSVAVVDVRRPRRVLLVAVHDLPDRARADHCRDRAHRCVVARVVLTRVVEPVAHTVDGLATRRFDIQRRLGQREVNWAVSRFLEILLEI